MTKEVLVSLVGSQVSGGEKDNIELVTVANYYKRNGHHYVLFDEYMEEDERVVKNTLRFDDSFFEMIKRGGMSAQLFFRPNESQFSVYSTPAGPLNIETTTTEYTLQVEERKIEVYIRYQLDINYTYSTENEIYMRVEAK